MHIIGNSKKIRAIASSHFDPDSGSLTNEKGDYYISLTERKERTPECIIDKESLRFHGHGSSMGISTEINSGKRSGTTNVLSKEFIAADQRSHDGAMPPCRRAVQNAVRNGVQ